jgi:hypothetical protein
VPAKKKRGRKSKSANGESLKNGIPKEKKSRGRKKKESGEANSTDAPKKIKKPRQRKNNENGPSSEKKKNGSEKKIKKHDLKDKSKSASKRDSNTPNKPGVSEKLKQVQNIKFDVEKYKEKVTDKSSHYFRKVVEAFRPTR